MQTLGISLLAVLGTAVAVAQADVVIHDRTVTAATTTMRATFRDGTLVAIENRTGGDSLFVPHPESTAAPALRDTKGFSSGDQATQVTCRRANGAVTVSLKGLAGDPTAQTELALGIEADGGLTLRQSAHRDAPELLEAVWGIAGIDAARTQIVVPAMGGLTIDGLRGPGSQRYSWPASWQAPLIVLQGEKGGFYVWAEDPEAQFKSVDIRRYGHELALSFGTETREPFTQAHRVLSAVWHIQAFRGDWRVAALAYRAAMAGELGLTPIANRKPGWIRDIRLVVRVSNDVTVEDLRALAEQVDPKQTLLYVPGWRRFPYDVQYPNYEPCDGFIEWCRAAQALGFRVMPHGNLVGISPESPELSQVDKYLQQDRTSGSPVGWWLDKADNPGRIYCLNPASVEVRRFLIDHFRRAWERVRFDALHLDFPVIVSTHEGDLGGMTCARGAEVYLRELQAALPEVALSTEGLNEALLDCSFAQLGEPFWVNPTPGVRLHPIRSLIFSPYCGLYGHLGLPSQATSFPAFLGHHDFFDKLGAWPTLSLDGALDPANVGTAFVLREARYFQEHRLTPAPEVVRWPEELFTWREQDGKIAAMFDNPPGRRLASRARPTNAAWLLLSRLNTYDGPGYVADWRAFDGTHLFGLNPERRYPIVDQPPNPKALHLISASQPIVLEEVRDGKRRALFRIAGQTALVADLVELAPSAAAGILLKDRQEPLSAGASFAAGERACGGVSLPGITAHPPWQGVALGGEAYGEFPVKVPEAGRTILRFAIGLADLTSPAEAATDKQKPLSDGATFAVSADGQEVFGEHQVRGSWAWREADLTPYSGKSIILRFTTGPGPRNDCGWDWAVWGQPRVVNLGEADGGRPIRVHIFSPNGGKGAACLGDPDQPGKLLGATPAEDGAIVELELPRPQPFGLLYDATPVAAGVDLGKLPFITGSTSGELLVEGPIYGSGTVGQEKVDGETWLTISGHPPAFGRTALDWCLQLPQEPLQLAFRAQLRKGGEPVSFEVQVNGQPQWALPMPYSDGWKAGSVDLSPWAGKPVLFSLVTDSVGSNNCDWAVWGNVRLEPRRHEDTRDGTSEGNGKR